MPRRYRVCIRGTVRFGAFSRFLILNPLFRGESCAAILFVRGRVEVVGIAGKEY